MSASNFQNNGPLPILFSTKEDCCGCFACYSVCPMAAISMREDEEGFFYPTINSQKCIRCFQCSRVCPIKKMSIAIKDGEQKTYE